MSENVEKLVQRIEEGCVDSSKFTEDSNEPYVPDGFAQWPLAEKISWIIGASMGVGRSSAHDENWVRAAKLMQETLHYGTHKIWMESLVIERERMGLPKTLDLETRKKIAQIFMENGGTADTREVLLKAISKSRDLVDHYESMREDATDILNFTLNSAAQNSDILNRISEAERILSERDDDLGYFCKKKRGEPLKWFISQMRSEVGFMLRGGTSDDPSGFWEVIASMLDAPDWRKGLERFHEEKGYAPWNPAVENKPTTVEQRNMIMTLNMLVNAGFMDAFYKKDSSGIMKDIRAGIESLNLPQKGLIGKLLEAGLAEFDAIMFRKELLDNEEHFQRSTAKMILLNNVNWEELASRILNKGKIAKDWPESGLSKFERERQGLNEKLKVLRAWAHPGDLSNEEKVELTHLMKKLKINEGFKVAELMERVRSAERESEDSIKGMRKRI